jgi:hypothetical protein
MTVPFGDGEYKTVYELTILKTSFFGLLKKQYTINYEITMFANVEVYIKHWDSLIKSKQPL